METYKRIQILDNYSKEKIREKCPELKKINELNFYIKTINESKEFAPFLGTIALIFLINLLAILSVLLFYVFSTDSYDYNYFLGAFIAFMISPISTILVYCVVSFICESYYKIKAFLRKPNFISFKIFKIIYSSRCFPNAFSNYVYNDLAMNIKVSIKDFDSVINDMNLEAEKLIEVYALKDMFLASEKYNDLIPLQLFNELVCYCLDINNIPLNKCIYGE